MTSCSKQFMGAWLSREGLPQLRRDFDASRAPLPAQQKTERSDGDAQQSGGPAPDHKPPPEMRRATDEALFNARWLKEQRDAAMRQVAVSTPSRERREQPLRPRMREPTR